MNLLNETLRVWAMHREFRAVLAELQHYSDRELSELGIGRGDIARVAYEEAERRIVTPAAAAGSEPPVGRLASVGRRGRPLDGLPLHPLIRIGGSDGHDPEPARDMGGAARDLAP